MILFALTIHEFAHAWTASLFGDPTARRAGRVTLNPLAHIDPLGAICFVLAGFGWGKPVPVNPRNLRHPKRDDMVISFAGPLSNFISAMLFGVIMRTALAHATPSAGAMVSVARLAKYGVLFNLILCFFNLIPIFPLDGSHVLKGLLPGDLARQYEGLDRIGPLILLALILIPRFIQIDPLGVIIWQPVLFFYAWFAV